LQLEKVQFYNSNCYTFADKLSLGVSTVKSNQDQDRDVSTYRDVIFQSVMNFSTVKSNQDQDRDVSSCQDVTFQSVTNFSTVEMSLLEVSRWRHSKHREFRAQALLRCCFLNCLDFLNCRDLPFQSVKNFSTVKMS
jgi:hypothetical protein